jgi:exonuclease V
MVRLHKSAIRVTDISGQYWCERQMELHHLFGRKITKEIKAGRKMHEALENESNAPVALEPRSYADYLYKQLYTGGLGIATMEKSGLTREIPVYGSINGYKLVGKIDQLNVGPNKEVIITENKVRTNDKSPSDAQIESNKIQLLFYKKMMDDIQSGSYTSENFKRSYGTNTLKVTEEFVRQINALGVRKEMQSIDAVADFFFKSVANMGKVGDDIVLKYVNQFTGETIKMCTLKYDSGEMSRASDYVMKYWRGERESLPVPESEKWKCNICMFFGKECKVWWPQNEADRN